MWAVRKPMHKETFFGHINLRRKKTVKLKEALENIPSICNEDLRDYINSLVAKHFNTKQLLAHFKSFGYHWNKQHVDKVEIWQFSDEKEKMVATRKTLDTSFDAKRIASITDTGIQKILLTYLETKDGNSAVAFTPEGIAELNQHIADYNGGKKHQPILKVRVSEPKGAKFPVGQIGNKADKFVEAQKGTNLYFAIYEDEERNRTYKTMALNEVVERLKQELPPVPEKNEEGVPLKFYISPNDLVYVPSEDEMITKECRLNKERIYKMVSCTGNQCFFVPFRVATSIVNKMEYSPLNKMEKSTFGEMIKTVCWKLEVDRLGNILRIIK